MRSITQVAQRAAVARELAHDQPEPTISRGERVFRGMLGMGTVFGAVGAAIMVPLAVGAFLSFRKGIDTDDLDFLIVAPFAWVAIAFGLGMTYAGLPAFVARGRSFSEVSIARAAAFDYPLCDPGGRPLAALPPGLKLGDGAVEGLGVCGGGERSAGSAARGGKYRQCRERGKLAQLREHLASGWRHREKDTAHRYPLRTMLWSAITSGFITGLLPIGLAEAAALALGMVQPPEQALTLLAGFTLAHVAGKVGWYWLGTQADRIPPRFVRTRVYVEKARSLLVRHPVYGAGIMASAAITSIPPFHVASIAAGIAKVSLWTFLPISIVGRAIRFGAIASAPTLIRAIF